MDLFELFRKAFETLKSNLLLFLPPLINVYLVPVALQISAAYVFIPIFIVAANSRDFVGSIIAGGLLGAVTIVALALVAYTAVLAGWGHLNRVAFTVGKTTYSDFKTGVKKYFSRVLIAIVITVVILVVLGIVGLAAMFTMGTPLFKEIAAQFAEAKGAAPVWSPETLAMIFRVIRVAANFSGVALILVTIGGLWIVFTLFWIPAIIVGEMGVFKALSNSFTFVKKNFYTALGWISLYIIAVGFTSEIFPGGGGGGGGGGPQGGYGFGFAIAPALEAVFRILIQAFFILLLYGIYIDRQTAQPPPSTTQ